MRITFFLIIFLGISLNIFGGDEERLRKRILYSEKVMESLPAFETLDSILKLKDISDITRLLALEKITWRCIELQKLDLTLKFSLKGIRLAEKLQDKDSVLAYMHKMAAMSFYYMRKPDDVVKHLNKAKDILKKVDYPYLEASVTKNLGVVYTEKRDFSQAKKYLNEAIGLFERSGEKAYRDKLLTYRILATLYQQNGNKTDAGKIYDTILTEARNIQDTNLVCSILTNYSLLNMEIGKYKEALMQSEESVRLIRAYGDRNGTRAALKTHAQNLFVAGQYKQAYETYVLYANLDDSIYTDETKKHFSDFEVKYKTQETEKEKLIAEKKALLEESNKDFYKLSLYLLIGGIILFLIIASLLYLQYKQKTERKIQKERLEAIIIGEEKERSRIAKDLHDGLVQELVSVRMQLNKLDLPSSKVKIIEERLDMATQEARNLSYEMMPVTLKDLGLQKAIDGLIERSLTIQNILVDFEAVNMEERLSEKIEVTVYRICQELINNTIKHSGATKVSISLTRKSDKLLFVYEDNGKGIDWKKSKKGVGWNSLDSRVEMVNGSWELDSEIDTGITAFIRIPLNT